MKDKPKCDLRQLVLLRHGESVWNKENLFTGWTDVDLSDRGREEGQEAGRGLKEHGFTFDIAFTSVLKRAIRTLWILLDEMDLMWIPVHRDWRLNERHYGALQGLNKAGDGEEVRRNAGQVVAAKLRHPSARPRRGRSTTSPARSALPGTQPGRDSRHGMFAGHRIALLALLARSHRADDSFQEARAAGSPRE